MPPGNQVANGSFEVGAWAWDPRPIMTSWLREGEPAHGTHFVSIPSDEHLESQFFPGEPARECTLSAALRADHPGAQVLLRLRGGHLPNENSLDKTVTLTAQWQRYQLSGPLPEDARQAYQVWIEPVGNAPVEVDAVAVWAGTQATYRPHRPVEVGVYLREERPGHILPAGQPVPLRVVLSRVETRTQIRLELRVLDHRGAAIWQDDLTVPGRKLAW